MATADTKEVLALVSQTTSVTSSSFELSPNFDEQTLLFDTTAVSGTSPTMDITIQFSPDNTNWWDFQTVPQITAVGKSIVSLTKIKGFTRPDKLAGFYRFDVVIGGTSPSFSATIDLIV